MELLITYIGLFTVIVFLGQAFQKSTVPIALILVIFGMLLSLIPFNLKVQLDPIIMLDFFLPILLYEICSFSSWKDIKKQMRQIVSLSIGHVLFITIIVAVAVHTLIPQMGWPLAFVLGAVISPPDDFAVVSISDKIRLPERIFLILEGEGMFNDVAALILFRFALAAALTHTFSLGTAFTTFILTIIGEAAYGLILGNVLGKIRLKITNTSLHLLASVMTPFLAYIPPILLGGTGILSTAIVGFLIGNMYSIRTTPEYRLTSMVFWPALAFAIEGLIFLLVGLNFRGILLRISYFPFDMLMLYVFVITSIVVIGRFFWVYSSAIFFTKFNAIKNINHLRQTLKDYFVISWAGMRGGISLAGALAVPSAIFQIDGVDLRDLVVFLVFCILIVTLILQGLTLPWILRKFGFEEQGKLERYEEHLTELYARVQMIRVALHWMNEYKKEISDQKMLDEIDFRCSEYRGLLKKYEERVVEHKEEGCHDEELEVTNSVSLVVQLVKIEKRELLRLWREQRINLRTRNKLLAVLDHQLQRFVI